LTICFGQRFFLKVDKIILVARTFSAKKKKAPDAISAPGANFS